jgi:acetyl esterase/lipase
MRFLQLSNDGRTKVSQKNLPRGSIDLFVEEDMEYARRLVHAGVATELLVVRGAFHGFDLLVPDAEASKQFSASWKTALRKAFATGKAV